MRPRERRTLAGERRRRRGREVGCPAEFFPIRRYSSFSLKSEILMYEMLGFFGYLLRFLYPLGVQNGSVLFESLFHGCEYLIRESLFCNFFCFSSSVFGSRFASVFASNGYNMRIAMSFHKFGL